LNRTGIGEMPQATPRRHVNTNGNWPPCVLALRGFLLRAPDDFKRDSQKGRARLTESGLALAYLLPG